MLSPAESTVSGRKCRERGKIWSGPIAREQKYNSFELCICVFVSRAVESGYFIIVAIRHYICKLPPAATSKPFKRKNHSLLLSTQKHLSSFLLIIPFIPFSLHRNEFNISSHHSTSISEHQTARDSLASSHVYAEPPRCPPLSSNPSERRFPRLQALGLLDHILIGPIAQQLTIAVCRKLPRTWTPLRRSRPLRSSPLTTGPFLQAENGKLVSRPVGGRETLRVAFGSCQLSCLATGDSSCRS